jgi:D-aminopeptidase
MGSFAGNGSGDLFIAFSTAPATDASKALNGAKFVKNDSLDPIFRGVVEATEEAIVNAMVAAEDMTGYEGHAAKAIDHDALVKVLKDYNRLNAN